MAKCSYCGKTVSPRAVACPNCGDDRSKNSLMDDIEESVASHISDAKKEPIMAVGMWIAVIVGFVTMLVLVEPLGPGLAITGMFVSGICVMLIAQLMQDKTK